MDIELKQIVKNRGLIERLGKLDPSPPLWLSVKLARNLRLVEAALEDYDEASFALLREIGEPNGRGGYRIPPDDLEAVMRYTDENNEALGETVSLALHPITVNDLERASEKRQGFEIPLAVLAGLDFLFDLSEDAEPNVETEAA